MVAFEGTSMEVDGALVVLELDAYIGSDGGVTHDGVNGVGVEVAIQEGDV